MNEMLYRQIMAQWASGVTVVTTVAEGKWIGVTASAFSSVSAEPPLVLICLNRKLYTHTSIEKAGVFAVNILSAEQIALGKTFAGLVPDVQDRFAGLACSTVATGCPILPGVGGWMDCTVESAHTSGDHTIFVGRVLAGGITEATVPEPLVYHRRRWGSFAELHPESAETAHS